MLQHILQQEKKPKQLFYPNFSNIKMKETLYAKPFLLAALPSELY